MHRTGEQRRDANGECPRDEGRQRPRQQIAGQSRHARDGAADEREQRRTARNVPSIELETSSDGNPCQERHRRDAPCVALFSSTAGVRDAGISERRHLDQDVACGSQDRPRERCTGSFAETHAEVEHRLEPELLEDDRVPRLGRQV